MPWHAQDWGADESFQNHQRVTKIYNALKSRGVRPWFDSTDMEGHILEKECSGIDKSLIVGVFVTDRYIEKVRQEENPLDNCKIEFNYATNQKTSRRMLAVPMEPNCLDPKQWKGIDIVSYILILFEDVSLICLSRFFRFFQFFSFNFSAYFNVCSNYNLYVGPVGAILGSDLYPAHFAFDFDEEPGKFEKNIDELVRKIEIKRKTLK